MAEHTRNDILAKSGFYFQSSDCPIAVRRVAPSRSSVHSNDYTSLNHFHDFAELVIIAEGEGEHRINGVQYPAASGDVFLIQGYDVHCFPERSRIGLINIMFDPSHLPLPLDWLRKMRGYSAVFEMEPSLSPDTFSHRMKLKNVEFRMLLDLADHLEKELTEQRNGFECAAFQKLLEIILLISRNFQTEPAAERPAVTRLIPLITLLEQEFRREWTLEELARRAAVSPNSLLRHFKEATGTSPIHYLIRVRLRRAAKLLDSSAFSVTEIAAQCGFPDSNYFTRKFHEMYGVSPRSFRSLPRHW